MWLFLVLWSWLMAGNRGPTTLYFSAGGGVPWQHATANGQILGAVPKTPPESESGCYGMGRLQDGTIWIAAERSFYAYDPALKTRRGGTVPVETIAGQSARFLYRIVRGSPLKLTLPAHEFSAVLEQVDPRTWSTLKRWTLPGFYSAYGFGHVAVDPKDSIAYYARASESCGIVHRHDLKADAAIPDLVARTVGSGGLIVLADGSIVVGYRDGAQRFAADGSHQRTYGAGPLRVGQGLVTHGADGSSFWVQGFEDGAAYSTLYEFGAERGEVRHQWNTPANGVRWDAPFVDPPAPVCVPAGSLAFPFTENSGFHSPAPLIYVSADTGQLLTASTENIYPGVGTVLDDGAFATDIGTTDTNIPSPVPGRIHEGCSLAVRTTLELDATNGGPSANNYTDRFYRARMAGSVLTKVNAYDATDGHIIQTWSFNAWPNPAAIVQVSEFFAVDPTDSILYYILSGIAGLGGFTAADSRVIYRYDLNASTTLTPLTSEADRRPVSVMALRNGELLVGWSGNNLDTSVVKHYAADGTELHSYPLSTSVSHDNGITFASDLTDDTFWVIYYDFDNPEPDLYSAASRIRVSDGTFLKHFSFTNAQKDAIDTAYGVDWQPDLSLFITREDCNCMACPDPCDKAGHDVPYLALLPETTATYFYDRAFTLVSSFDPGSSDLVGCQLSPATDGCWIAYDDANTGFSTLYQIKPDDGSIVRGPIPVEVLIGELGGSHALFTLSCDHLLTVDRTTHELVSICLPAVPDEGDDEGAALVDVRYSLTVDPLDGFLVDGGKNLLYVDSGVAKVWNLKNDALLRTIGTVGGIWPTVLNDNTFLVYTGAFLSGGGEVLRYSRNGTLKMRYSVDIGSVFSAGLYGMAADLQTDACSCGNNKAGVIFLPGEENPAVIPVQLLDGEQESYIILDDVAQGGVDTAAAFTVLTPSDGSGFNTQTSGGGGTRRQPNRHCGDEGKLSTVSPNPGCNPGGVGWTRSYNGASGVVPDTDDPVGEETLTGKSSIFVDVAIRHTAYPSETVETIRAAHIELDDTTRKEGRLESAGDLENSASDAQGNMKSASAHLTFFDADGRPFGGRLTDATKKYWQRDEVTIQARSDVGRRTGATPRVLWRGLSYGDDYGTPIIFGLNCIDHLFIEGGAFSPDKKIPQYTFPLSYYTEAPKDLAQVPMPIIIGEVSDEGAVNVLTGLPSARGKCPVRYVGMDGLGTGPGGEPWGRFNVCMFAIYKILSLYGSDLGGMSLYGRNAVVTAVDSSDSEEEDTVTTTETTIVTLDGSPDLSTVPADETAQIVLFSETGRVEATITAVDTFAKTVTINSTIDPALAQGVNWYISSIDYVPKRVSIDLSTRNGVDTMVPKWSGYIRPTDYEDFTSTDFDGRVTDIWVRGPLLDAHLSGEVTLAVNAIGIEDQGDASGLPITDYFTAMNFLWDNLIHRQLAAPLAGQWPQTDGDVEVWSDGLSKTKQSSFAAAQTQTVAELGGRGLQMSAWLGDGMPLRDLAQLLNDNGSCRTYIDEHGRVGVWRFNAHADTSTWTRIDHVSRIFGDIKQTRALDEAINYAKGGCDWDADGQKFREDDMKAVSDDAIVRNKGIRRYSKHIDGKLIADKAHFQNVLDRVLMLQQDGPIYVDIQGLDAGLADLSVGDGILLTSIMGPGSLGYTDRPMVILDKRVNADSLLVALTCLDVGDQVIASAQRFLLSNTGVLLSNDTSIAPRLAA